METDAFDASKGSGGLESRAALRASDAVRYVDGDHIPERQAAPR
ncbi:MAG: hypothetical protein ACREXY_06745 [Gammaproteobacteria bacterium]